MRSGAAERGQTGGSISLPDQKASHPLPDYETEQILIVCRDEAARIFTPHRSVCGSEMGQPRRGKGFGVREEGGNDGSREDAPIFEVVVGNRGQEGAVLPPGGMLDGVSFPEIGR
jgi:hypothetical protein